MVEVVGFHGDIVGAVTRTGVSALHVGIGSRLRATLASLFSAGRELNRWLGGMAEAMPFHEAGTCAAQLATNTSNNLQRSRRISRAARGRVSPFEGCRQGHADRSVRAPHGESGVWFIASHPSAQNAEEWGTPPLCVI
jgi:hypothetical protein